MSAKWLVGAVAAILGVSGAYAQARRVVRSGDDLPRFTYPVPASVADMLMSPPDRFEAFASPVIADDNRTLAAYDLQDKATLREILKARLGSEIASAHNDDAALRTLAELRAAEEKAEAKLMGGLVYQAFLEARLQGHEGPGVCPRASQPPMPATSTPCPGRWSVRA